MKQRIAAALAVLGILAGGAAAAAPAASASVTASAPQTFHWG